jgi:hypothetical protein
VAQVNWGCGLAKRGCSVGKFSRTVTRDLLSSGTLIYRDVITLGPFNQITRNKTSERSLQGPFNWGDNIKSCAEPDYIV